MQSTHVTENKIEPIHFVWIGPPKFKLGGQDVIGIMSITENFKKYGQQNPLIFLCQKEYQPDYINYFAENNIKITVSSLEDYLDKNIVEKQTTALREIYTTLLSTQRINDVSLQVQMKDRVRIKNLFFLFLVVIEGGYVLDTNVRATKDKKVNFISYETFHFPWVEDKHWPAIADIWMLYSPHKHLPRAEKSLNHAIANYHAQWNEIMLERSHDICGDIQATQSVTLAQPRKRESFIHNTWLAETRNNPNNYLVKNVNVLKEYNNSHYSNKEHQYSAPELHAFYAQPGMIKKDIQYGLDPRLFARHHKKISFSRKYNKMYDAENETLLHIVMRKLNSSRGEHYLQCARIYLENGADPNAIYRYIAYDKEGNPQTSIERSPLFDVISLQSMDGLKLLFEFNVDVSLFVNGKSIFMHATQTNFSEGVQALLEYDASSNIRRGDKALVYPLFSRG